jgi:hypothetical protein
MWSIIGMVPDRCQVFQVQEHTAAATVRVVMYLQARHGTIRDDGVGVRDRRRSGTTSLT